MNHLAHALLAGDDEALQLGGMLGDFVHGQPDPAVLPSRVIAGIRLHRAIDVYTDAHPEVLTAKALLPSPYRRYAGILLDMWFDRCLARDFPRWSVRPLPEYSVALRALLWRRYQDLSRADLAAARAGRTLGLTILWLGVAQVLFVDLVGGIWTMLIGWFLMNAARMETDARLVRQALAELSAAQVMRPVPDRVAAWHTVQACIEQTIAHSWQSLFPVVDEDGGAVGLITTDQLIAIPAQRRGQVSVRDVMTALPAQNVRRPEARAIHLIEIRPAGGRHRR